MSLPLGIRGSMAERVPRVKKHGGRGPGAAPAMQMGRGRNPILHPIAHGRMDACMQQRCRGGTHLVVLVVDGIPREVLLHEELLDHDVKDGCDRLGVGMEELLLGLRH